jgi:hypothetical protein
MRPDVLTLCERSEFQGAQCVSSPKAKRADRACPVAGDDHVTRRGEHFLAGRPARCAAGGLDVPTEADAERDFGPNKLTSVCARKPVIGIFYLMSVVEALAEESKLIVDAVTCGRKVQSRERVEEAGREPTEATMTKPGIALVLAELAEIDPDPPERCGAGLVKIEREQRVREGAAEQEFHRQIAHPARSGGAFTSRRLHGSPAQLLSHQLLHRREPVAGRGFGGILAPKRGQPIREELSRCAHQIAVDRSWCAVARDPACPSRQIRYATWRIRSSRIVALPDRSKELQKPLHRSSCPSVNLRCLDGNPPLSFVRLRFWFNHGVKIAYRITGAHDFGVAAFGFCQES